MPSPRNRLHSLASLLAGEPDAAAPVSFDRSGVRSRGELRSHVAALSGAIAAGGAGRWPVASGWWHIPFRGMA